MHSERPTCLAKILGVFEVSIKTTPSGSGGGKAGGGQAATKVIDVLVMENIFYGHSVSRIYDLKGSLRGRYNAAAADPSKSGEVREHAAAK
jgi:1-phosphatidylinositol-3-phosphate 5-kinase